MEEKCQSCGELVVSALEDCCVCGNEVCEDCGMYIDGDITGRFCCDNCVIVEEYSEEELDRLCQYTQ